MKEAGRNSCKIENVCLCLLESKKVQGREVWGQNRERLLPTKVSSVPFEEDERAESLREPEDRDRDRDRD